MALGWNALSCFIECIGQPVKIIDQRTYLLVAQLSVDNGTYWTKSPPGALLHVSSFFA